MPKLTLEAATLKNPQWSDAALKPGSTVTMQADAPQIKPDQFILFLIRQGDDVIDSVAGDPGKTSATWKVLNLPNNPKLKFDAVLKGKATPKNGFQAVIAKVTSPEAPLQGFSVAINTVDAAFVPHTEKIQVAYTVTDPGGAATKGRYEIWGERYPNEVALYTENFIPADGAKTWDTWDGKANAGKLSGKYISPEFSPYRVRVFIAVDQPALDDAFGAGAAQVAAAETPFEVEVESVQLRIQVGFAEAAAGAANAKYRFAQALAVETYAANGNYRAMGRLPLETEPALLANWQPGEAAVPEGPGVGRIRIPMAFHNRSTDWLQQGGILISGNYMHGAGAGDPTKHAMDQGYYTRPELPLEFETRLRSRVAANNTDTTKRGLFDKEAVGPVQMETVAEDSPPLPTGTYPFQTGLFADVANGPYWKNASFKVKNGAHNAPVNSGAAGIPAIGLAAKKPVVSNWQVRRVVAADGDQTFDLDVLEGETTYHFAKGGNQLTVWLNRTKLVLAATEAEINKGQKDYIEVDSHTIKIRPNFTKQNDVLWIVRSDPAKAVPRWTNYPPGLNCHDHYGGIRGSAPNNLFRQDYSPVAAGHEPQIGKITAAYPYKNFILLAPDSVPAAQQERVEVRAQISGAQQGLAGILFSPSYIAGDTYILHALLDAVPYARNYGWIADRQRPRIDSKTGTLSVWRVNQISNSLRLATKGTAGLAPGVGSDPDTAIAARKHIGDGVNMNFAKMNKTFTPAFNEWTMAPPNPALAPAADVHKDVPLATYRTEYMRVAFTGQVPMASDADVTNRFVPFDHYRDQLPPNTPANRVKAASNAITLPVASGGLKAGTTSLAAMNHVQARYTALEHAAAVAAAAHHPPQHAPGAATPDEHLAHGATLLGVHPGPNATDYDTYVDGVITVHFRRLLNKLTPPTLPVPPATLSQPKTMQVIRWPQYQDNPLWDNGAPPLAQPGSTEVGTVLGADYGDGQSLFATELSARVAFVFPHEMGHSVHLAHYVASDGFEWKHHHLLQPDCMMSYNFITGFIVPPGAVSGPIAPGTPVDEGWPDRVPAPPPPPPTLVPALPVPYHIDPTFDPDPAKHPANPAGAAAAAAAAGKACIRRDAIPGPHFGLPGSPAPSLPCAKCMLKLRGWDDSLLPVAWKHPDLF